MYCSKCGKEIPDGAKFCPGCGLTLTATVTGASAGYDKSPDAEPPRPRVGMWQAYKNMLKNWHFAGRASRQEYWLTVLCNFIIFGILIAAAIILFTIATPIAGIVPMIIFGGLALYSIIPILCLEVRRLHDIGKSGWWYWVGLVPWVGGLILFVFMVLPSRNTPDNPWHKG